MPRLTKDLRIQEIKPKRTGYDVMPANASAYEKRKIMRDQVSKGRKSPDINQMHSVSVPDLKITYYFQDVERRDFKEQELKEVYPGRTITIKEPVK